MKYRWLELILSLAVFGVLPVNSAELATTEVKKVKLPLERWLNGKVQAVYQSTVSAETSGRVQEILYDVGDEVPAGSVILKLVSNEQQQAYHQSVAAFAEAQANLDLQSKEFARIAEVYQRKLVSKTDYDRAVGNLNTAKARRESAKATVKVASERLSYTLVKAPYGGVVLARHVELGESVQPGKSLMSGFDPKTLRVEVDLPQSIFQNVARLRKAHVLMDDGESIEPSKLILFPQADQTTGTVHLRLELPAQDYRLRPGMFVKVAVVVGEQDRLLVPISSIFYRSEVTGVYVLTDAGFVLRQVRLGNVFDNRIEVVAGILPRESVATDAIAASILTARVKPHE